MDKGPKSYKIGNSQVKGEDCIENQQDGSFLEYLDGVSTPVECLVERYKCQAQMDKLKSTLPYPTINKYKLQRYGKWCD